VYVNKAFPVENLDRDYKNRNIYILSDTQAAIKTLDNYQIKSKLVWDCYQSLVERAKHKRVQLIRMPSHEDIQGDETAGQLAKFGS
jgi:predicted transcriptional regulator